MKRNLFVLVIIVFIGAIIYFATKETPSEYKSRPTPSQVQIPVVTPEKKIAKEENFPRFVAGRAGLIKKSEEIYKDKPLSPNATKVMAIGNKVSPQSVSQAPAIKIVSLNTEFASDLYACYETKCEKSNALFTANGFHIFRGPAPTGISKTSKALVTYNKENYRYGIWEGRVIIELKTPYDFSQVLEDNHFVDINRPQQKLFIAQYEGELSSIDETINILRDHSEVQNVRLEITYSRDSSN